MSTPVAHRAPLIDPSIAAIYPEMREALAVQAWAEHRRAKVLAAEPETLIVVERPLSSYLPKSARERVEMVRQAAATKSLAEWEADLELFDSTGCVDGRRTCQVHPGGKVRLALDYFTRRGNKQQCDLCSEAASRAAYDKDPVEQRLRAQAYTRINITFNELRAKNRADKAGVQHLPFRKDKRDAKLEYYGYRCWLCGDSFSQRDLETPGGVEWDHVLPIMDRRGRGVGGPDIPANYRPAHGAQAEVCRGNTHRPKQGHIVKLNTVRANELLPVWQRAKWLARWTAKQQTT